MAVDYFHRLIVSGPARDVQSLRAGLVSDFAREVKGEVYVERLPFSFAGLFSLAPAAKRCEPEGPMEPYDIRVWPIVWRSQFDSRFVEPVQEAREWPPAHEHGARTLQRPTPSA
jgi:hypothetical protein